MITKRIKQFIIAGSVCCCVTAAMTACSDWDDHYDGAGAESGSQTSLWQEMNSNPQLSNFCKVLEGTKVFRMHKKTPTSYAQLLDGGQSFTVVAPVNGTFNHDSLLQLAQTNQGDSIVEKFFIKNHLSRTAGSMKEAEVKMLMMNSKNMNLSKGSINGVTLNASNIHTKNGILHIAAAPLPYEYNLYEALNDLPEMSGIGQQLRQYEEDYFVADASVSSGIVEGVPVYVDSVVVERNRILESIGSLNDEDSTYLVVAPRSAGWEKAWENTKQYFVYDEKVLKRDSLQEYWTARALMDDAVFNMNEKRNQEKDSLYSVPYLGWYRSWSEGKPVFHRFLKSELLQGATEMHCSNGKLYEVDEWPFTPEQTFLKEIWTEGESSWLITAEKDCSYNVRSQVADSISSNAYLQIVPRTATSNWELTYRLNNTLSAEYEIYAVILPRSVAGLDNAKPCKFKATLNYVDEKGASQTYNFENVQFKSNPEKVDSVLLGKVFLPACNYNQTDIKVSIKLVCSILARETANYSREMYLDCIYLRPRTSNTEEQ